MFQYTFMQNALTAAIVISILCPSIGIFLVLRRYSMIGDTLSHSSLAGVAIGLVIGYNPMITAFVFTTICAILIELLRDTFKKYAELILVIVLTLSVGIAITLISSGKTKENVNSYLFGSILTITRSDLVTVLIIGIVSVVTLICLYNKLVYISYDEEGAKIAGIKVSAINYIFALLVGATVSISMRILGILVVSSMIAIPVATAMQLNKSFKKTLMFSILFGFIDIISGLILSYYIDCAPGGMIAIVSVGVLLVILVYKKLGIAH